ncbi:MAG: hypothetical protein QNJ53_14685 [Pleurocapsa sp. MO_192.B19]|nr:hypothetical protein [Pleurocapsa sp. MO_192.B19]
MAQALVWNHVSPGNHPVDLCLLPEYINLDFLDLKKKEVIAYGLKKFVIYHEDYDYDSFEYLSPVASVAWQTVYDEGGNTPLKQIKRISWKLNDGSWSEAKEYVEPIRNPKVFQQKRRGRVIEELIDIGTQYGFKAKILALYEKYQSQIGLYKDGGSPKFRNAIVTDEAAWLDVVNEATGNKPRDVLVQYLSIGVVIID